MSMSGDVSRRHFLRRSAAFSVGFAGLHALLTSEAAGAAPGAAGFDGLVSDPALVPDPAKILDLPAGFSYVIISRTGEEMTDGLLVPGKHDGMAAFPGPDGSTILVRNHELTDEHGPISAFGKKNERAAQLTSNQIYDGGRKRVPTPGGTTTLVYDTKQRRLVRHSLSLAGTLLNCAGGPTPWGSWLTCEETVADKDDRFAMNHGWVFEVPANADGKMADPVPIKHMGRFKHEAVAIDPRTGIVYLSEDVGDGVLYRYIPKERGKLHAGGRLQALRVREHGALDTYNHPYTPRIEIGRNLAVAWEDLRDVESPDDTLRKQAYSIGCARFARNEGMWWGNDGAYFAATSGGRAKLGQVWKYTPSAHEGTADEEKSPGVLSLFVEPNDPALLRNCDNLTVAPNGDLFLCEDPLDDAAAGLARVSPQGVITRFAVNRMNKSELAGACFSPDGSTLFVNIQSPGLTFAISGPWNG